MNIIYEQLGVIVLIRPKLFGFGEGVGGGVKSVTLELIPEYIPNIYKISTTNDDVVNLDNTELLNVDDKIKIIDIRVK